MEGESVYTNFVNFSMSVIGVPHVTAVFENIPQEKFVEVVVQFQELPLIHTYTTEISTSTRTDF